MHRISLCLLFLWIGQASAQPEAMRVCTIELPPHTMLSPSGQPDGHATEVLRAVASDLGWPLDFQYLPWTRLVVKAKSGQCDIVYTVLKRKDYEEFLTYPKEPVQTRENVLVVRKDSHIEYDGDIEQFMRSHSVGLYRDKAVDDRFETLRHAPWARVDEATDANQNLKKLLAGRFDAALENSLTAAYELKRLEALDKVLFLTPPINVTPAYIAFPKAGRLGADTSRFDAALVKFKQSSKFKSLNRQYLGQER